MGTYWPHTPTSPINRPSGPPPWSCRHSQTNSPTQPLPSHRARPGTSDSRRPRQSDTWAPHRPHLDPTSPTSIPHRPHLDPTSPPQSHLGPTSIPPRCHIGPTSVPRSGVSLGRHVGDAKRHYEEAPSLGTVASNTSWKERWKHCFSSANVATNTFCMSRDIRQICRERGAEVREDGSIRQGSHVATSDRFVGSICQGR